MNEKSLWEYQRARHRHAEAVLTRVFSNKELMRQVFASLEAIERGEHGVPLREIQEQERLIALGGRRRIPQCFGRSRRQTMGGGDQRIHGQPALRGGLNHIPISRRACQFSQSFVRIDGAG